MKDCETNRILKMESIEEGEKYSLATIRKMLLMNREKEVLKKIIEEKVHNESEKRKKKDIKIYRILKCMSIFNVDESGLYKITG